MATSRRPTSSGSGKGGAAKGGAGRKKQSGPNRNVLIGIAVGIAVIVAAGLFILSRDSTHATGAKTEQVAVGDVAGAADVDKLLAGIPQKGTVLGFDEAPATLVEYGDLRCPACRQWDNTTAPKVIEQLVRTKKAKLEFRLWPITGDASGTNADAIAAARAGMAAANQDRYWNFALLFYRNQGDESTTYATDAFVRGMAKAAGVPDLAKFDADRADASVEATLQANGAQAASFGFSGTPSFATISPSGQEARLEASETDVAAIGAELAALK